MFDWYIKNKTLFLASFIFFFALNSKVFAEKTFYYHSIRGPKEINAFQLIYDDTNSPKRVEWKRQEAEGRQEEEIYFLDDHWQTVEWSVQCQKDKTSYTGKRIENLLIIKGWFKNQEIDKRIKIDDNPFYVNPKINLTFLLKSGKKNQTFWGIRSDNLDVYKLKASVDGTQNISVNGKNVEAVKVSWAPVGFTRFFQRNYWFRAEDGIYIKQNTGSLIRELIDEQ